MPLYSVKAHCHRGTQKHLATLTQPAIVFNQKSYMGGSSAGAKCQLFFKYIKYASENKAQENPTLNERK